MSGDRALGDLSDWIDLSLVPGLGPAAYRALLAAFGLPAQVFAASRSQLARVVGDAIAEQIRRKDRSGNVERTLRWLDEPSHHLVTLADATYPPRLFEIADPPPLLYVRGDPAWLQRTMIAIVGSRNATAPGKRTAEEFSRSLCEAGCTVISGLALGIDTAAHRGALQRATASASTVAVLGTGADRVYPRANADLFDAVAAHGAIISEFPLGTEPLSGHFPRRNRLISGLSQGVLVVEAAMSSGSLITARMAAEQGREVFAIPGSIHSPVSRGCHALIKQGAKLVESAGDVIEEMTTFAKATRRTDSVDPATDRTGEEDVHNGLLDSKELLQHMGYDPVDMDSLAAFSGLTPAEVSAMLLTLELEGRVASLPGGLYQRTR